tara:strand:+ start:1520 stop:2671 length:1152 start_codon:yes stop_codon:yes gene_type:complete
MFSVIFSEYNFLDDYTVKKLGRGLFHYYVGYYDIDPLHEETAEILCHRIDAKFTKDIEPEYGDIGLISPLDGNFTKLTETRALNWQLASRAQWLNKDSIIFNDIENEMQVSKVLDITTKKIIKTYERPFWAISPNGRYGTSLNFQRIKQRRPGYGYKGSNIDQEKERIVLFELNTGVNKFVFDLEEIFEEINFDAKNNDPYLNHIAWSPCSTKLLTIFHYEDRINNKPRCVFPIVFDLSTNAWNLIDTSGFFSHHVWLNDNDLLAYIEHKNNTKFCIWNKKDGWIALNGSIPSTDGHPSPVLENEKIIIDSYPNRLGKMRLYLASVNPNHRFKEIGYVMNIAQYKGPLRCDLHPRFSNKHSTVICDIPGRNGRRILIIEGSYA